MKLKKHDFDESSLPWPNKGDLLISDQGERMFDIYIGASNEVGTYTANYKRAGDIIWKQINTNPSVESGFLAYPMIFLYRHYTELSIKNIIYLGRNLVHEHSIFPMHHRLSDLWSVAYNLISQIDHAAHKEDLDAMTSLIGQFDKIDPASFAFRYPIDKDGEPVHPNIYKINLATLREGIEKMNCFFDGCIGQFEHYKSASQI